MKNLIKLASIGLLFAGTAHAQNLTPEEIVVQYFEASKLGDIDAMRTLVGGAFYKRRKVLWDSNSEYPEFLRGRYGEAALKLEKTEALSSSAGNTDAVAVPVTIKFPESKKDRFTLLLTRDTSGIWKIVRQETSGKARKSRKNIKADRSK